MIPMPRKWITVNIPADMHDHIADLIAQIEREIKEDKTS